MKTFNGQNDSSGIIDSSSCCGRPHTAHPTAKINNQTELKTSQWFLSRVNILTRDIDIANLSVRDVPVSDENGLTYRHSFFHHTVARSFCFYRHQTSSRNSDGVTPCGGAKYRWGIKISRFSTNKSLYLANDTRYRHSYYGKWIGNRTQAFEWHQFQWPWVTLV